MKIEIIFQLTYKVLDRREECRSVEAEWIDKYDPEWNSQSGWNDY